MNRTLGAGLLAGFWLLSSMAMAEPGAATPGTRPAVVLDPVRVLLAPQQETTLSSQAAGRLIEVNASLGSAFRKGDVLVQFDCAEPAARLKMSEAELATARERHQAQLRMQGLKQAAELEVALAAFAAEKARAELDLYRAQLANCRILAPFDGRVVRQLARAYQSVSAGQSLLEVVSSTSPKLRLNVPASWTGWLKPGLVFTVQIDETGRSYAARVSAINGRVDAVSQTLEIEGLIERDAADLLPGMSGMARFTREPGA